MELRYRAINKETEEEYEDVGIAPLNASYEIMQMADGGIVVNPDCFDIEQFIDGDWELIN